MPISQKTYISKIGSEAIFYLQSSGNECKHALSVMFGGNTVGRIHSQHPDLVFPQHITRMGVVSMCVCMCMMCACACVISCIKPLTPLGNGTLQFTCFD